MMKIISFYSISVLSSALFYISYFEFEDKSFNVFYSYLSLSGIGLLFGILITQKQFHLHRSSLLILSLTLYISSTSLKLCEFLFDIEEIFLLWINNLVLTINFVIISFIVLVTIGIYSESNFKLYFSLFSISLYLGLELCYLITIYFKFLSSYFYLCFLVLTLLLNSLIFKSTTSESDFVIISRITTCKYLKENVIPNQKEPKKIIIFSILLSSQFFYLLSNESKSFDSLFLFPLLFFILGGLAAAYSKNLQKLHYFFLLLLITLSQNHQLISNSYKIPAFTTELINYFLFSFISINLFNDFSSPLSLSFSIHPEINSDCRSSLFTCLVSSSLLLSLVSNLIFNSFISQSASNLIFSSFSLLITCLLSLSLSNPLPNPNIIETEPAESGNQISSQFEKLQDDSSNSIILNQNHPENQDFNKKFKNFNKTSANVYGDNEKSSENVEKSLQDLEYNCIGILCGYYEEDFVRQQEDLVYQERETKTNLGNSRRGKSIGESILEQIEEESSVEESANVSKASSLKRSRRKSEGSSSGSRRSKDLAVWFEDKSPNSSRFSFESLRKFSRNHSLSSRLSLENLKETNQNITHVSN